MASWLGVKALAGSLVAGLGSYYSWKHLTSIESSFETLQASDDRPSSPELNIPSRDEQLKTLRSGMEFDVLVIGGGVTGTGVALDATLRGLNTACVERYDFSSGTSSRSTKLIHGGVRYLQKAIMHLDLEQYRMVKEALHERANLLKIAPHLSYPLPIMLPVYKWWQVPYYWAGIKAYDIVSGKQVLKRSYFLRKSKALEEFPMLKPNKLCGTIVYYDGQHDDARMNLTIALTAVREGATLANHVEVTSLIKDQGVVRGARLRDRLTQEEWDVRAKVVVNATGPFCDSVRLMDNPEARKIVQPSAGIHIVLPEYYSPRNMGLLDPSTSDGRIIFFLPWQGRTIAGTTDAPIEVTHLPTPREEDIRFILAEIKSYLSPELSVRRGDVLAAWSGIRPLVMDPNKKDTQSIARNHVIEVSESKLLTISGGKWTTYRSMAQELVDKAVEVGEFTEAKTCLTDGFTLEGGEGWNPNSFIRLVQDYGVDVEVAQRLASTYGDKAPQVAKLAALSGKRWPLVGKRLVDQFPYIEAEVKYAIKEYACTVVDVLARRTRLAFLDVQAADEAVGRVAEIMAKELKWSKARTKAEEQRAKEFLGTMGLTAASQVRDVSINLTYQEAKEYALIFHKFDKDRDGHISAQDLRKALGEMGEKLSDDNVKELIAEVDINKNYTIEEEEFLQLMSAIKSGEVANVRLGTIVQQQQQRDRIPVDRSGGGL